MSISIKFLLVDKETNFVYTHTTSQEISYALCEGVNNSLIVPLTERNNGLFSAISSLDYFHSKIIKWDHETRNLIEQDINFLSQDLKKNQQSIQIRRAAFYHWENLISIQISKTENSYWSEFENVCIRELDKCQPTENHYSYMIEDYADMLELPVYEVYKNLKNKIETNQILKFKIISLAERWKNKINLISRKDEFTAIQSQMVKEFQLLYKV